MKFAQSIPQDITRNIYTWSFLRHTLLDLTIKWFLPDNPEGVSIKMPTLYDVLVVLEDNLNEGSIVSSHDWGIKVRFLARWKIWDTSNAKNAINVEVICKLKRRVSRNERYTVNSISLLAIDKSCWTLQLDSPGNIYQTIVIRALRIRSRSASSEISPKDTEKQRYKLLY